MQGRLQRIDERHESEAAEPEVRAVRGAVLVHGVVGWEGLGGVPFERALEGGHLS